MKYRHNKSFGKSFNHFFGKFLITGIAIGASNLGHAVQAALPPVIRVNSSVSPVVRATGYVPQVPSCYIEMPNQAMQSLDGLCQMGKPKAKRGIDMTTDLDKDGIPDELALEFRKLDAVTSDRRPVSSLAEAAVQRRQMVETVLAMNERMPYAESTKAAMREMAQMMQGDSRDQSQWERMNELNRQMDKDPMFQKVQQYSNRFYEQKWQSRSRPR